MSRSLSALNKQDQLQVKAHVQTVCDWAYQNGLLAFELRQLLDIVTRPNALGQASCAKIIKSLYPATAVSVDQLCIVVGALGLGSSKPSFSIQDMLLKWIIMTYEVLENPSILLNLYSVLFNMLDISSLRYVTHMQSHISTDRNRARLCNLLSLITRRHHVKPFRIQILFVLTHFHVILNTNFSGKQRALTQCRS